MNKGWYKVIIPADMRPRPKEFEIAAAAILAEYFKNDVTFIQTNTHRTSDIKMGELRWEMKSPRGSTNNTIKNNLRIAVTQSNNIVLDLQRVGLHQRRAVGYVR